MMIPEVYMLAALVVKPSPTSASVERSISALKRIKSHCRLTQRQAAPSSPTQIHLQIPRSCIRKIQSRRKEK
jgi:hypothetical protein